MKKRDGYYKYIVHYIDALFIISRDPIAITNQLEIKFKLKLKNTGSIKYHLGSNFGRDSENNTLIISPTKYIRTMLDNYTNCFDGLPREVNTPLVKGHHPN